MALISDWVIAFVETLLFSVSVKSGPLFLSLSKFSGHCQSQLALFMHGKGECEVNGYQCQHGAKHWDCYPGYQTLSIFF